MTKHMLIDATHPEETRVVVVSGKRLEEFDVEIASRKQLKGNIYLAKVVRVEPSLQAAFVDYGGNRHGFLAFNEIHPDYYRIPMADREALQAELEAQAARHRGDSDFDPIERSDERGPDLRPDMPEPANGELDGARDEAFPADEVVADDDGEPIEAESEPPALGANEGENEPNLFEDAIAGEPAADTGDMPPDESRAAALEQTGWSDERLEGPAFDETEDDRDAEDRGAAEGMAAEPGDATASRPEEGGDELPGAPASGGVEQHAAIPPERIETLGGDEADDERDEPRRPRSLRRYKIQEVVKRRQIMLVQVTKEERGNKGAALTTYLSLAGRYCVLMPNTARGGGISRKITSANDRKRLKSLVGDLDIPRGMAVIVRTAGSERSKAEIKRDYEYLLRLWNEIRDLTLRSTAPALIYEEANLIKRSIRDLYTKDIDDIVVEGEEGYKTAKAFMRTLTPSHAKRVQAYRDPTLPLLQRYQIESQLDAMHNPVVQLKSGGYIVINQTEALVSIDVNSGRATRERNIEDTALKTNLEASDEIARQLRLRDLAGLVVIDFIDMEEHRHNAQVERRFKEAMRFDRARIQLGRISAFGLLEMSRQRLRPSLFEASTEVCRFCRGTGRVRSTESTALHVLRAIEEEGSRRRGPGISVAVPGPVALYILNQKRRKLSEIESRHGFRVYLAADDSLIAPDFRIDRLRALAPGDEPPPPALPQAVEAPEEPEPEPEEIELEAEAESEIEAPSSRQADYSMPRIDDRGEPEERAVDGGRGDRGDREDRGERGGRRRRRRRRRGGGHGPHGQEGGGREEQGGRMAAAPAHQPDDREPDIAGDDQMPAMAEHQADGEPISPDAEPGAGHPAAQGGEQPRRRRRRGRRGGRRRSRHGDQPNGGQADAPGGERQPEWAPESGYQPEDDGEPPVPRTYPYATPANPWGVEPEDGADDTAEDEATSSPWNRVAPDDENAPGEARAAADATDRERSRTAEPPSHRVRSHDEPAPAPEAPQPAVERATGQPSAAAAAKEDARAETAESGPRRRGWWRRRE
jgi:ribonuclease E